MSLVKRVEAKDKWFLPGILSGLGLNMKKMIKNIIAPEKMLTLNYPEQKYDYSPRFKGNHV